MASGRSGFLSTMTQLDGTNYESWSIKCKMLLKNEGLWSVVETPVDVSTLDPGDEEDAKKIEDFHHANEKALSIIILTLQDQQLVHVRNEESAAECWNSLRRIYVRDSVGAHINLTRKLFRARLVKGGNMLDHLNRMKSLLLALHEKELIFSELHQVYIILSSLDESYDDYVTSFEVLPKAELSLTGITSRLLEESRRREDRRQLNVEVQKPAVKEEEKKPFSRFPCVRKCYKCGAKGHLAKHCNRNTSTYVIMPRVGKNRSYGRWVVDSGATQCITNNKYIFEKLFKSNQYVKLANGWNMRASGEGKAQCIGLSDKFAMLFMPKMVYSLLSVSVLVKAGYSVNFSDTDCIIEKEGSIVKAKLEDGLYMLQDNQVSGNQVSQANSVFVNKKPHDGCIHLLHRKMGHLNFKLLKKTIGLVNGVKIKPCSKYVDCNICNQSKSRVMPANRYDGFKTKKPLELVFMDVIGPKKASLGGNRYILSIMDHYSRYGFCYLMKSKSDVYNCFFKWLKLVERKQGDKVVSIVTDNGTEFTNNRFVQLLSKSGIEHQHNSFVERRGQTLQAMIRTMINDSGLPESVWGDAAVCANHLLNCVVNATTGEIPFTRWHGRKPDLSYLQIFGSPAWVHIPCEVRRKHQHRARKMFFVGYGINHKSYRFWDRSANKIYCSANAKFLEHIGWNKIEQEEEKNEIIIHTPMFDSNIPERQFESQTKKCVDKPVKEAKEIPIGEVKNEIVDEEEATTSDPILPRRGTRVRKEPDRYQATMVCQDKVEPSCYNDVIACNDSERKLWIAAMNKELNSLKELGVYEEVVLPKNEKAIGCKWVYKIKTAIDGSITHKARLVAQGFSQTANDYDEVFAPSLKANSLRSALVWAGSNNYVVHHIDVETAYLHADLQHNIYMRKPVGLEGKGKTGYWKLKKSLYGLKQSGFEWNQCIVKELKNMGFTAGLADPCIFRRERDGQTTLLLLFTDDIAIIAKTECEVKVIVNRLKEKFRIRYLGEIRQYLGLDIEKTSKGFKISQVKKINDLLTKYKMNDCNGVKTPMSTEFDHSESLEKCDKTLYQGLIGSLAYLANWSRPDISYSVNQLARYSAEPSVCHWNAAKRILRYLKYTCRYALHLEPRNGLELTVYADANFANDTKTRKSTSGIAVLLGNVLVGWKSIRQQHISMSTMEAEFSCLSLTCTELIYYKQMLKDIGICVQEPVTVYEDNQAAISMANNLGVKTRSKHTDLRYLNVRECVQKNVIKLVYCESENNIADQFTKAQGTIRHDDSCVRINLKV